MSIAKLGNGVGYVYVTHQNGTSVLQSVRNIALNEQFIKVLAHASTPTSPYVSAISEYRILSVNSTNSLTAFDINSVSQITAAVNFTFGDPVYSVINNIAAEINSTTPGSGPNYSAVGIGDYLYVITPQGSSVSVNDIIPTVTQSGLTAVDPTALSGGTSDDTETDSNSGRRFYINADVAATEGDLTGATEITTFLVPQTANITQTVAITSTTGYNSLFYVNRTDNLTRVKVDCSGVMGQKLASITPIGFANGDRLVLEPLVTDGTEYAVLTTGGNIIFNDDPVGNVKIGDLDASDGSKIGAMIFTYEDGYFKEFFAGKRESPAAVVIPVDDVFGRTGNVVAAAGDYDDTEVSATITPVNYTKATDFVAGHLSGIDAALGTAVSTDLSISGQTSTSLTIESSTGVNIALSAASITLAGLLNATDKQKLKWLVITGDANIDNFVTEYRLNNDGAVVNPVVGNDGTQFYAVGSRWTNTATGEVFYCVDAATGAAVWASSAGGVGVDSVFGRTGTVVATSGDYSAAQVTNVAAGDVAATTVQAAIDELDGDKIAKAAFTQASSFLIGTGAGTSIELKNNYGAAVAPGATDDSAAGYAVGSEWIDLTGDLSYKCVDSTASAAVWSAGGGGGGGGVSAFIALTELATTLWDLDNGTNAKLVLTASRILSPSNMVDGSTGELIITNSGSGGLVLTLPANSYVQNGGAGVITTTLGTSDVTRCSYIYDGTNWYWSFTENHTA